LAEHAGDEHGQCGNSKAPDQGYAPAVLHGILITSGAISLSTRQFVSAGLLGWFGLSAGDDPLLLSAAISNAAFRAEAGTGPEVITAPRAETHALSQLPTSPSMQIDRDPGWDGHRQWCEQPEWYPAKAGPTPPARIGGTVGMVQRQTPAEPDITPERLASTNKPAYRRPCFPAEIQDLHVLGNGTAIQGATHDP
jgi:hypothetical protein